MGSGSFMEGNFSFGGALIKTLNSVPGYVTECNYMR